MPGSTATWAAPYPVLGDPADIGAAVKPLADRLEALLTLIKAGDPNTIEGLPIGVPLPYTGSVLPNVAGGPVYAWADGSLIDKTTYGTYFARTGHAYNGGVDPGGNQVRLPDKRGRIPMGADSFGVGSGGRIPVEVTAGRGQRGQNGGEERHALTAGELAAHSHPASSGTESADHSHSGSTDSQGSHTHVDGASGFLPGQNNQGWGGLFAASGGGGTVTALWWGGTNSAGSHGHNFGTGGRSAAHTHAITVSNNTGGGGSHQNLQPYEADNYIVRIG